jgi:hypothetical protein
MVIPSGQRSSAPVRKHGFFRRLVLHALGFEGKIDHHGIFLHDGDQKNDADQRHHRQIFVRDLQSQDRAYAGQGQRGEKPWSRKALTHSFPPEIFPSD